MRSNEITSVNSWEVRLSELVELLSQKNQVGPKSNISVFWAFKNNIFPALKIIDRTLSQFDDLYFNPIRDWDYKSSSNDNLIPESGLEFQVDLLHSHDLLQDIDWVSRIYHWKGLKISGKRFFDIPYEVRFDFQPYLIRLHSNGKGDNLEFEFDYNKTIDIAEWERIAGEIGEYLLNIIERSLRERRLI